MRPWAVHLRDSSTLLDWCCERLRTLFPGHRHVLVVDAVDAELLAAGPARSHQWVVSACWSDVDAWLDAARQLGAEEIIAAHLEAALCPVDVCARVAEPLDSGVGIAYCASLTPLVAPQRLLVGSAAALRRTVGNRGAGATFADLFAFAGLAEVDDIDGWPCRTALVEGPRRLEPAIHVAFESSVDVSTLGRLAGADGDPLERWLEEHAVRLRQERIRALGAEPPRRRSSSSLRILFVSNPSAMSGAESSTVELIGGLRRVHVESAALVAFEGDLTDRLRSVGCKVYCQNRGFLSDGIESWNLVADAITDFQPDVVHYCGRSGRTAMQVTAASKRPLVFLGHVPFPEPYREAIGWANKYVAVSTSVADAMQAAGLPPDSIVVVPNGVDARPYGALRARRDLLRRQFGLSSGAFVAASLSRFSPEKRLTDVVEAISLARREGDDVELLMAGETCSGQTTVGEVTARIQELKLESAVRLLGQLTDVRPILALADVLVICSSQEGLPMAALEAMATGIPIIATEAGALADLVGEAATPGICGLRVRMGAPADIAAAITRLRTQPDLGSSLSREGLRLANGPYSIDTTADRMMNIYKDVCRLSATGV
jgi:glycosyltransferase involved in cell wall biosynthesis